MRPAPIVLAAFGSGGDPLADLRELPQAQYLRWYLADRLHRLALEAGPMLVTATGGRIGLTGSSRIARLSNYVGTELARVLAGQPAVLGKTRLALLETVAPMSLHLGVVRFGSGRAPVLDVLYDTTDSMPNMRAFCHVAYHPFMTNLVEHIRVLAWPTSELPSRRSDGVDARQSNEQENRILRSKLDCQSLAHGGRSKTKSRRTTPAADSLRS